MKKILIYFPLLLLLSCHQSNNEVDSENNHPEKTEEEIISEIQKRFYTINADLPSLKKVEQELMGESTEGGTVESYYQDQGLAKIVANYYGEMGQSIEEYYFSEDKLFFVFSKKLSYDKPMYVEGSKVTKTIENRYYFYKDKIVRWLDADKAKVDPSRFEPKETEILAAIRDLKEKAGLSN